MAAKSPLALYIFAASATISVASMLFAVVVHSLIFPRITIVMHPSYSRSLDAFGKLVEMRSLTMNCIEYMNPDTRQKKDVLLNALGNTMPEKILPSLIIIQNYPDPVYLDVLALVKTYDDEIISAMATTAAEIIGDQSK